MELTLYELLQSVESLKIENDEQLENANKLAKAANKLEKEVKAKHKEEIANYHNLHKEAKAKEKEELKPIEKAKALIKTAIGDYMKVLEQRKLELLKQQEEEKEILGEVITQEKKVELNGTHVRKTWKARIIDADKVPVKYENHVIRSIDMTKLNEIAKYTQGEAIIEGVEFYQEETVVIR